MSRRGWLIVGGLVLLAWAGWQTFHKLEESACLTPFVTLPSPLGETFTLALVGDAGNEGEIPKQVAQAVAQACRAEGCNALVLLGDNLYPNGISVPQDPRFQVLVLDRWSALGIPVYVVLGNHDVRQSGLAQVALNGKQNWNLPSGNYGFSWGPARLLFLNSNCQGLEYLSPPSAPHQPWTLIFQHHNLYGTGDHGDASPFRRWLFDVLWGREADLVISGHEHLLEHLTKRGANPQYLISGAAGGDVAETRQTSQAESRFREAGPGFVLLQVSPQAVRARFFDARPVLLKEVVIHP